MRKLLAVAMCVALVGCSTSGSSDETVSAAGDTTEVTDEGATEPQGSDPEASEESTTTTEAKATGTSRDEPLAVGEVGTVGNWEVKVVEVIPNATDQVMAQNEFNEPPSKGQYMLVKAEATYRGDEEGTPDVDLTIALSGGDAVQYKDFDCRASVGTSEYPTLEPGGTAAMEACLDVPAEAVDGGVLFIEDSWSFEDDARGYWALS